MDCVYKFLISPKNVGEKWNILSNIQIHDLKYCSDFSENRLGANDT